MTRKTWDVVVSTKSSTAVLAAVAVLGVGPLAPGALAAGLGRQTEVNMSINLTQTVVRANTLVNGFARRDADDAPTKKVDSTFYTASVKIDELGRTFNPQFSTSMGDTWFRGDSCTSTLGPCSTAGPVVDPTKLTAMDGVTFTDAFHNVTGDLFSGHVTINAATVALDFGVSDTQGDYYLDGVVGYGSSSGIQNATAGLKANFFQQLGLTGSQDGFGLYLAPSGWGTLTLGGWDPNIVKGEVSCSPVDRSAVADWTFRSTATFSIQNTSRVSTCKSFTPDLSSVFISIDDAVASTVNQLIGAHFDVSYNHYTIPCDANQHGPTVSITLDTNKFDINPAVYVIKTADDDVCLSGFQGGMNAERGTLGQPFLKSFYSIYDRGGGQTCFGRYEPSAPVPPPPKLDGDHDRVEGRRTRVKMGGNKGRGKKVEERRRWGL